MLVRRIEARHYHSQSREACGDKLVGEGVAYLFQKSVKTHEFDKLSYI